MPKFLKRLIICLIAGITLLALAFVALAILMFGRGYNIKDHDPVLEHDAAIAQPVIEALEKYHLKNGAYPETNKEVIPSYFATSQMSEKDRQTLIWSWRYNRKEDGKGYVLALRLSWDPELAYEFDGSRGEWVYMPGDGTPNKVLKLGP